MAPSRVDSNKKRAKSSIGQVEEELYCIDTMARTVSGPSQATVHMARRTHQELYHECLDEGEAWQLSIPKLLYKIDMQARFAAARATVCSIHFQCQFPRKHLHHVAILMMILMVHLHH